MNCVCGIFILNTPVPLAMVSTDTDCSGEGIVTLTGVTANIGIAEVF